MNHAWRSLGVVCVLVIGVYAYMAESGALELQLPKAADTYYNLLVQGFRAGQLNLKKEVPPGLAQLADPYDPDAHSPYGLLDLSFYKGKLYLYFGVTPALILFWPYAALTGHYLFHRQAVVIFCVIGFLASVGLLHALWRRYFAEVSVGVVAACALALGLATGVPVLLTQCDVYEVAISSGYMLTMLALAAIWCALHEPERRGRWLAVASVAYGLAVGARPNLLFGAVILLVPVIQAWRERQKVWVPLMAATIPITLIGLGLMLYNDLRFNSPFEFGWRYMITWERQVARQLFKVQYLWFNFRAYFLRPSHWSGRSPFVQAVAMPPPPAGYGQAARTFGILTNIPIVWLALAVPLAWRNRPGQTGSPLRWFVMAVGLLFGICALTLGLFTSVIFRYEVDFLPALLLLAVVGVLGLERALVDRPMWQRAAVRWSGGVLLGVSVAFNLLAGVEFYAEAQYNLGYHLVKAGNASEAIEHYRHALRLNPDYAEVHNDLGWILWREGKLPEATEHLEAALRLRPEFAEAHCNLGAVLWQGGKLPEAMQQFEQAVRLKPDYADAYCSMGSVLWQLGKMTEAIQQYGEALRIRPDMVEAHANLGGLLKELGRMPEAIQQYEQALQLSPDLAEIRGDLGFALMRTGRVSEAIQQYEEALRISPDLAEVHNNLGIALELVGKTSEAIDQYERAVKIKPDYTQARNALQRLQAPK